MKNANSFRNDVEVFTGFKPAIEACYMDWDDYPLPGITYTSGASRLYHCPFTCFRHAGDSTRAENLVVNQVRVSAEPFFTFIVSCFSTLSFFSLMHDLEDQFVWHIYLNIIWQRLGF
jgi:hypothetical protein